MSKECPAKKSLTLIRGRLCDHTFVFRPLSVSSDSNYSKLKFIVSTSITEGCNNSILLLGPRGSGKAAVLDLVVGDLLEEYPDSITVIRLNGLLHCDDNCAFKEIARQLCMEHHLLFSKMASFDENSQFIIAMLRQDVFEPWKLANCIVTCFPWDKFTFHLDADQLLEKRVRPRFSHRKILFLPPSGEEVDSLLHHLLSLPADSSFPSGYVAQFNEKIKSITSDTRFKDMLSTFLNANSTVNSLLKFIFRAVSSMTLESGLLSLENFKAALSSMQRQPKLEAVRGIISQIVPYCQYDTGALSCSMHEEVRGERAELIQLHQCDERRYMILFKPRITTRKMSAYGEREVICYAEIRGQSQTGEYRPMELLISASELHQGMRSHACCPAILLKLLDH
ncbi:hypothetical protein Bca101_064283 [Brassica carinata]